MSYCETLPNTPKGMRRQAEVWRGQAAYLGKRGFPKTAGDYREFAAWAETRAEEMESGEWEPPTSSYGGFTYRQAVEVCRRVIVHEEPIAHVARDLGLKWDTIKRLVVGETYRQYPIPCRDEEQEVAV